MSETARYASHDSLSSLGFLSDTLRLFVTVDVIDLLHNPFGPLHGSGNHLVGSRTSLRPAEQIVCPVERANSLSLPDWLRGLLSLEGRSSLRCALQVVPLCGLRGVEGEAVA
jgi:hypothetical protein